MAKTKLILRTKGPNSYTSDNILLSVVQFFFGFLCFQKQNEKISFYFFWHSIYKEDGYFIMFSQWGWVSLVARALGCHAEIVHFPACALKQGTLSGLLHL